MSRQPIVLSADLQRLQNEGYDIDIRGGYLLIKDVPYVNADRVVERGILISKLELSGDKTNKPTDHTADWTGSYPCHSDGRRITAFENGALNQPLFEGVHADFKFSAKADYRDYHHKMTSYIARISGEASLLDPLADARTYPAILPNTENSPFYYEDTASSRAGIAAINSKIANQRVGIVGLGGTGSYILDLVAKTHVAEIHLIDGDVFSQHNAFRAPSAPTIETLQSKPHKVTYLASIYSNMHRGIVVHDVFLDDTNVSLLNGLDFVFVCLDRGGIKKTVVEHLVSNGSPFIEVGLGINITDDQLSGIIRTTTSTQMTRQGAAPHISYSDDDAQANEYTTNIQIAELNALNAVMAVIQWKKLFSIYHDRRKAVYTGYSLASGEIVNEGME
jgi:hypothetical protein